MKRITFLLVLLLGTTQLMAQKTINGLVVSVSGEALVGATLQWENTMIGAVTDTNGQFQIESRETASNLIVRYVGFQTDTFPISPEQNDLFITLSEAVELEEVEVTARQGDNRISTLDTRSIDQIESGELRKAACCSLAESFETNASVDVTYNDAVTGAREIQMLGLRGLYTQMLMEKRPAMTGLGAAYALEYIPGTWVESIQISKGAGSVQNGYQSITGQINNELVKPWLDKPLFLNLYSNIQGRGEINLHLNKQITDKWSSGLLLHSSITRIDQDIQNDGFQDIPDKTQFNALYRLFYRGDLLRSQFNIHAIRDERRGGQIIPEGANPIDFFRISQLSERVEVFGKIGYLGFDDPNLSIGWILNGAWHELDSYYGNTTHQGLQRNFYTSLMQNGIIGNSFHKYSAGLSYLYDDYEETLNEDTDLSRTESVPGAFLEYSYSQNSGSFESLPERLGIVAGMRVDYHNLFGWLYSPRLNVKYNFNENSVVRLSGGRGYRTANVIAENINVLASSKAVVITEDLNMESAWNAGVNFSQRFTIGGQEGSIALDLFRTSFENQVVMDIEFNKQQVLFYNLEGQSYANSLLLVWMQTLAKGLDMKAAYKFNDVQIDYVDSRRQKPLVAKHRALFTLDYETPSENWMFNTSVQIVGPQRLPDNSSLPGDLAAEHPPFSPTYALVNAQVSYRLPRWEFYVGGENLTGYRQESPIIDAENPFGEYFDAMQVYAPVMGPMAYAGLRVWIDKK
jgi:outer membrane receptor for ferrienterochelin and colicins